MQMPGRFFLECESVVRPRRQQEQEQHLRENYPGKYLFCGDEQIFGQGRDSRGIEGSCGEGECKCEGSRVQSQVKRDALGVTVYTTKAALADRKPL